MVSSDEDTGKGRSNRDRRRNSIDFFNINREGTEDYDPFILSLNTEEHLNVITLR